MSQIGSEAPEVEIEGSGELVDFETGGEAPEDTSSDPADGATSDDAGKSSLPPRDPRTGQFRSAKSDLLGTEPDSGEEPTGEAPIAPAGTTEAPDAPVAQPATDAPPGVEGAQQPPQTKEPEKPALEQSPWSVTMDKEEHPIEGAVFVKGHGVLIPESHLSNVERLVSRGLRYDKQWREMRELQSQLKAQSQAPSQETLEARELVKELRPLMSDSEQMAEFIANPEAYMASLLARVEAAVLKAENEQLKQGLQRGREEISQVDTQEHMQTEFRSAFDRIAEHPYFKGKLDKATLDGAYQKLARYHQRFFRQADRDYPEYGIRQGELILEQQVIVDELTDRLAFATQTEEAKRKAREEAEKVAAAERRNQENLQSRQPAKPAVPVARRTTGQPAAQPPAPTDRRKARRELLDTEFES